MLSNSWFQHGLAAFLAPKKSSLIICEKSDFIKTGPLIVKKKGKNKIAIHKVEILIILQGSSLVTHQTSPSQVTGITLMQMQTLTSQFFSFIGVKQDRFYQDMFAICLIFHKNEEQQPLERRRKNPLISCLTTK